MFCMDQICSKISEYCKQNNTMKITGVPRYLSVLRSTTHREYDHPSRYQNIAREDICGEEGGLC